MSAMEALIYQIQESLPSRVAAVDRMPQVELPYQIPEDLTVFYTLCGGIELYPEAHYPIRVVSPHEVVLANPVIVGELCSDDISASWHIIATDGNGDYLTIDLHPDRLGRCYDSFRETHGLPGSCPIIARTFTELLSRLIENKGQRWYWLDSEFAPIGDAYQ